MEEVSQDKIVNVKPRYSKKKIIRSCLILIFGLSAGYFHYKYVSTIFENIYHFSHLSELEREMSFRSEMGFYYSYYKTIVQEHPFIAGISKLMYDRLVEYPKDVNAFNRFNIHQEVIIGGIYRYFEPWLNRSTYRQCHMVDRGGGLSPVESCVGIGHPIFFYLEAVWVLAGLLAAVIFLHATLLSESIIGGLVAILQYFANHQEGTRVHSGPNERENFAAPLLFMQMWFLTLQLRERQRKTCFELQISIFILNCLCLLFWQFTQFIFLTQTAIFFVMEQLRIIDLKTLCVFLHSHFCGLHMAVLLLQGNDMLKSSMYASFFIVVSTYCLFFSSLRIKVKTRVDFFVESWLVLLRISIAIVTSLYLKKFLGDFLGVEDDQHIWDLLYSKFTSYESFHTLIYTCSDVFDFLPMENIMHLTKTFLIPFVLFACVNMVTYWFLHGVNKTSYYYAKSEKETQTTDETASETEEIQTENEKDENVNENEENETDDSGIENNENGKNIVKKKRVDLDDLGFKIEPQKKEFMDDPFMLFVNLLDIDPAIFYNISQMCVFGLMAVLFMRLKLLFVTQMCIVSSLATSTKYVGKPSQGVMYLLVGLAGLVLHRLYQNMSTELSGFGEFRDVYREELLLWISKETNPGAVFAGSMPILSAVMLSTRRAIVTHPHYENADVRARTYAVYKMYGRFSSYELYQELTKLKATYLIVEKSFCYGRMNKDCSFQTVWDVEAPAYKGRPHLCHTLFTQPTEHLYKVFVNNDYAVFRVHDLSVRYMPRVLDT